MKRAPRTTHGARQLRHVGAPVAPGTNRATVEATPLQKYQTVASGTLTFLLTDVEASTRLWERYRGEMRASLARHDELIESLVRQHHGQVVRPRGEGDSRFAVFPRASDGVAAACAIQCAFIFESWPIGEPLRVRIALHTGEADWRDGDYYGSDVNRCARLRAVAYGGQTLLSGVTADLVRDTLPEQTALRELGVHSLKDLAAPERVYQLLHPKLRQEFPPLATLSAPKHNLPVQLTSLIGREREVASIKRLLLEPHAHLVTLTGPGGVGKTRVAFQVAAELLEDFTDGVFQVQLATLNDPAQVLSSIVQVFGIREHVGSTPLSTLTDFLQRKSLLLVLDNFEHLLPSAVDVVNMLGACPQLKLLVTSRAPLQIYAEQNVSVAPLQVPVRPWPSAELLIQNDSLRLFIERAHAVNSNFQVTSQTAPTLAQICARLDGLPLAIELAAARIKLLPPEAILARLEHPLKVLVGGPTDRPSRQQTLRQTLEWSYDLLDAGSQAKFRQLAVFVGGFTFKSAESVWAIDEPCSGEDEVVTSMSVLVDQSLVRQVADMFGEPQFDMLETVREFALEQLEAHDECDTIRLRHANYFASLADQAMPELNAGPEHAKWLERLGLERDNLRTAVRWCVEAGQVDIGLRIAGGVWRFWHLEGTQSERAEWLRAMIGLASAGGTAGLRARALRGAAPLAIHQGDLELARALLETGLTIAQELHDLDGVGFCLHNLGALAVRRADFASAWALLEEAAATWRKAGDRRREVITLNVLAGYVAEQGDYSGARARYSECLAAYQELGDEVGIANAQGLSGLMALLDGDVGAAQTLCESALQLARNVGHRATIAWSCLDLARVELHKQEYRNAQQLSVESLLLNDDRDQAFERVAAALAIMAGIATETGQYERAVRLFGAAEQCLRESSTLFAFFVRTVRMRWFMRASRALGEEMAANALSQGRALRPRDAVAYAFEGAQSDS